MSRVWAVAKNSFVSAMRMKTAIVFMLLLIILLPIMSLTTTGDGTIKGRIQSFITYGLGLTSLLLSILTIVVSCHTLSAEIKHKQIYTVVTKPVRRYQLILGKVLGIAVMDIILLAVFATIIYALSVQMPKFAKTTPEELAELNAEFFTARASLKMTVDQQALDERVQQVFNNLKNTGQIDENKSKQQILKELKDAARYSMFSAEPGGMVIWEFHNVKPFDSNEMLFIRLKFNATQIPPDNLLYGVWYVGDYRQVQFSHDKAKSPIYAVPRKDVAKTVREFQVPADAVADDGYLAVVFFNEPANNSTLIFSEDEGLEVLYKAGSFTANYIRAVIVVFSRLVFFAVLGVSLTTWLGFPVAILFCFVVFFTGVVNGFVVTSFDYVGESLSILYSFTIKPLLWLLPKFDENYNINKYIIDAKLINAAFLSFALVSLGIKSVILLLAGFIIFAKRELARVIV
ncbi:MAG: hypothetical protein A2Y12_05930 [Planctomycetes bacterium GWF2_42_9]|nr:MAG: hypothetical protein A2Y12_05930 [Planctomycetes bacterium GWF2_42_9]HAL45899.1 hypothetical protein [Phycisphaerales bacterium]